MPAALPARSCRCPAAPAGSDFSSRADASACARQPSRPENSRHPECPELHRVALVSRAEPFHPHHPCCPGNRHHRCHGAAPAHRQPCTIPVPVPLHYPLSGQSCIAQPPAKVPESCVPDNSPPRKGLSVAPAAPDRWLRHMGYPFSGSVSSAPVVPGCKGGNDYPKRGNPRDAPRKAPSSGSRPYPRPPWPHHMPGQTYHGQPVYHHQTHTRPAPQPLPLTACHPCPLQQPSRPQPVCQQPRIPATAGRCLPACDTNRN